MDSSKAASPVSGREVEEGTGGDRDQACGKASDSSALHALGARSSSLPETAHSHCAVGVGARLALRPACPLRARPSRSGPRSPRSTRRAAAPAASASPTCSASSSPCSRSSAWAAAAQPHSSSSPFCLQRRRCLRAIRPSFRPLRPLRRRCRPLRPRCRLRQCPRHPLRQCPRHPRRQCPRHPRRRCRRRRPTLPPATVRRRRERSWCSARTTSTKCSSPSGTWSRTPPWRHATIHATPTRRPSPGKTRLAASRQGAGERPLTRRSRGGTET